MISFQDSQSFLPPARQDSTRDWTPPPTATLWRVRVLLPCAPMAANLDPDAALMLRVKEGDRAAFEDLVNKYKQPVTNVLFRTLGDATEAEDLAQNVFVQVYKSAHRYKDSA